MSRIAIPLATDAPEASKPVGGGGAGRRPQAAGRRAEPLSPDRQQPGRIVRVRRIQRGAGEDA